MKKAVFCDIDGTLLTTDKKITINTKEKIQALHRLGIPFILVSARMPDAIYPILEELQIHAPIIAYGGALILNEKRQILKSTGLSFSTAENIQEALPPETDDYRFCFYSGDKWIVSDNENPVIRREEVITTVSSTKGSLKSAFAKTDTIHKLMCFGPSALLDKISAGLKTKFPQCAIYKSSPVLLEIMNGRVSKSNAIHTLCRILGISPQNSVAFGDNYNDVDMLKAVGLGIAMGNAPDEVKQNARETTADNDHEGVLLALERLFPSFL